MIILIFFLLGVLCASFIPHLFIFLGFFLLFLIFFSLNKKALALFSLFSILGAGYFLYFDYQYQKINLPLNKEIELVGFVEKSLNSFEEQKVDIRLTQGKIRMTLGRYPVLQYGDEISFVGVLRDQKKNSYFYKEGIVASTKYFKDLKIIKRDQGFFIKTWLFKLRNLVQERIESVFSPTESSFMSGLLLGKSAGFSKQFLEKLKITGTTHLIALSGYNVTIIATSIFLVFGFLGKKFSFYLSIFSIIGFVIMTGAEPSVVRAAIMALIMFSSKHFQQGYSLEKSIIFSAFLMSIFNPKVLVFDVGFQLSFFALFGITYVSPRISKIWPYFNKSGFLLWRENLLMTFSAQITVLPILFYNFGFFSPISLITNILILTFIPITMGLGFFVFLGSLISSYLASMIAILAKLFLIYELFIIDFFSKIDFGIQLEEFPIYLSIFYYLVLISFVFYADKK